ncbi:MAG: NAD(P)-dependent oxidoreductase [Planctomycetota bacterium]
MKVVVTGGSGNVGGAVARHLASSGHDILVLDVRRPRVPLPEGIRFRLMDLSVRETFEPILEDFEPDAIAHLGELNSNYGDREDRVYARNAAVTGNVLTTCAEVGLKRIVYASSCQVYAQFGMASSLESSAPARWPLDESEPVRPCTAYGVQKVAAELQLHSLARRYGVYGVALRMPATNSPRRLHYHFRYKQMTSEMLTELGAWLAIDDAARAFETCLTIDWPDAWKLELEPDGGFAARNVAAKSVLRPEGGGTLKELLAERHPRMRPLPDDWPADRPLFSSELLMRETGWEPKVSVEDVIAMAEEAASK